eukprot:TRINITY_DN80616_c0_g1_i1.p1 TRINITY_DN80616_c0_g1~~TRINITY_DN80616_c0_g1_i1.p1  ORF type:complete len:454 (+),score=81.64 TRINITY_DN80616_c0_g1_i1:33-1394(+)
MGWQAPSEAGASLDAFLDGILLGAGLQAGTLHLEFGSSSKELVAGRNLDASEIIYPGSPSAMLSDRSGGGLLWRQWTRNLQAANPMSTKGRSSRPSAYDALLPLAATLALQLQAGSSSAWWPFLRVLPQADELVHLTDWPRLPEAKRLANADDTLISIDRTVARLAAFLHGGVPRLDTNVRQAVTSAARRAFALTTSRAVTCKDVAVMNPAIALMNHAGTDANVMVDATDCSIRTVRPLAAGEPIRVHYGFRPCLAWIQLYGFLPPDDEDPSAERVAIMLPPLEVAAASGNASWQMYSVQFTERLRAADQTLGCSRDFMLPPSWAAMEDSDGGDATGYAPSQELWEDMNYRYPRCWWLRVLSRHWQTLLPHKPELINVVGGKLAEPWPPWAGRWLPGPLPDQAAEFTESSQVACPWQEPTSIQRAWWADTQRCLKRQASVLESWASRFRSVWS